MQLKKTERFSFNSIKMLRFTCEFARFWSKRRIGLVEGAGAGQSPFLKTAQSPSTPWPSRDEAGNDRSRLTYSVSAGSPEGASTFDPPPTLAPPEVSGADCPSLIRFDLVYSATTFLGGICKLTSPDVVSRN